MGAQANHPRPPGTASYSRSDDDGYLDSAANTAAILWQRLMRGSQKTVGRAPLATAPLHPPPIPGELLDRRPLSSYRSSDVPKVSGNGWPLALETVWLALPRRYGR